MGLPDSAFLAAPLWLLDALHLLTLSLHLVAMNFVLGGTVVVLLGRFGGDRFADPTVKRVIKLLPTGMAATISLGVAPLLFLQVIYPRPVYAAAIVSGWWWLGIVLASMVAYASLYAASFTARGGGFQALCLGAALAGLLYVSLVYTSVFSLAEAPQLAASLYASNPRGLSLNPDVAHWGWRWLHMVSAAVAVGGFLFGLLAREGEPGRTVGRRFFVGGMLVAALFGILHALSLGEALLVLMRGGGALWLMAGIVLAAGALYLALWGRPLLASVLLFGSIVSMAVTRHVVRLIHLGADLPMPPLRAQWPVFGLFLLCLVAALGAGAWMVRAYFRSQPRAG